MPIYDYACQECGHTAEEVHKMASAGPACPVCRSLEYHKVPSQVYTDLQEFRTPIEMYSVAVNSVEEARELKKKCPDADISDDINDEMFGVPIARSRAAKKQVLKASGYIEK